MSHIGQDLPRFFPPPFEVLNIYQAPEGFFSSTSIELLWLVILRGGDGTAPFM
jgi:hypothetical protein